MTRSVPPLCIIGDPVSHSLSPLLHTTALRACGLPFAYEAIAVTSEELEAFIREVRVSRALGFNVTLPHKESIVPMLDTLDGLAKSIGAVNTVVVRERTLIGYNTDVVGVEKSLLPFRSRLSGANAVVIGSGGAARAVVAALIGSLGIRSVTMVTRNMAAAARLCTDLQLSDAMLEPWEVFSTRRDHEATLVVQTTPLGMYPNVETTPLGPAFRFRNDQIALDVVYRPHTTPFLRRAAADGATTVGGAPMLLFQAAAAFRLWTGREMPLDRVRAAVESQLAASS